MDKLNMHTPDKVDENIKKIAALYPNTVTEVIKGYREDGSAIIEHAIDFDVLRQELSDVEVDGPQERYQFTWPDKRKSVLLANAPIAKTLRPCREKSVDFDKTENIYIEGDNLDALKLLQETYLGKVKMIYIDPPYNTGNDFVYDDDFKQNADDYMPGSGQYDEDGGQLVTNLESNGRFHTDWLNMIYPRLKLAKDLLTNDGAIFISIDDNELDNLIKCCDEVFGASNFINVITLRLKNNAGASGGGEDKRLKKNCEYMVVYAKNYSALTPFNGPYVYTEMSDLIQQYLDEGKSWKYTSVLVDEGKKEYIGSTIDGEGNEIKVYARKNVSVMSVNQVAKRDGISVKEAYKKYGVKVFRTTNAQTSIRARIINYRKENSILEPILSIEYVPRSGKNKGTTYEQFYKDDDCNLFVWLRDTSEIKDGELYKKDIQGTLWDYIGETKNLAHEGDISFPNGKKPVKLIKQMVSMLTESDDTIIDFFSGSATTAHAVMQLNAEDGGHRKFIMVQLPEETDEKSEARKAGYNNICEIGEERIRRAGKKIKEDNKDKEGIENLDTGFRVFKVDSTNMKKVYYKPADYKQEQMALFADNIKPDRTPEDLLFQVMLDLGILLSSKIEEKTMGRQKVFSVADGYLIACFDNNVTSETVTEIAKQKPYYAVFRDSGMASDSVATNFEQIFKTYSPTTVRKVL